MTSATNAGHGRVLHDTRASLLVKVEEQAQHIAAAEARLESMRQHLGELQRLLRVATVTRDEIIKESTPCQQS